MLNALSIRDVVIIEALDLEFDDGLCVLTGETGAGKSILLDSLGLALGARADSNLVRNGAGKASVTAIFDAPQGHSKLAAIITENEIDIEAGEALMIRRTVKADGGSRAYINDQPCSAALLRDIGSHLVEIHGQHDDRGLLNPRGHRLLLDSYARADIGKVNRAYEAWKHAENALEEARERIEKAENEREWLEHSITEIGQFAPIAGEEAELALERATMQKGERLTGELKSVMNAFDGSKGGLAQFRGAARRLDRMAEDHPLLAEALGALDRSIIEATEAEDKLLAVADALRFEPQRLDDMETRLFDLRALARKHQVAPDNLAELLKKLETQLEEVDAGGAHLVALKARLDETEAKYVAAAEALHEQRVKAGMKLDKAVAAELAPLKLDAAKFQTAVEVLPREKWTPSGSDRVEFLISTNPGAPFAPLIKIASGGELSRFILALKVALAEQGGADTIIFDEIDRGVGGAVASAIGDRLARLAGAAQIMAVTHSPQVAARGKGHLLIAKSHDGIVTRTGVTPLDSASRQEEIARMLSGTEVTPEARAQADRLLEGV